MKRLMALLVLGLTVWLSGIAIVPTVQAVDVIQPACVDSNGKPLPAEQLPPICKTTPATENPVFGPHGIITTVINILSLTAAVVAVFVIIIGGIKMITSSGDSNSVASARRTILYAVVSLVIVGVAQAGVHFLLTKL